MIRALYNGFMASENGVWPGGPSERTSRCRSVAGDAETARHGRAAAPHLRVWSQPQSTGARDRSPACTGNGRARRPRGGYRTHLEELLPATSAADSRRGNARHSGLRAAIEYRRADGAAPVDAVSFPDDRGEPDARRADRRAEAERATFGDRVSTIHFWRRSQRRRTRSPR